MRITALLLALFIIVVSLVGIVATDSAMTIRRLYFATPSRFYAAGAVRIAMGLVLILAASISRWPRTLRALGTVMCLQAIAAHLFGLERARAIMEWEAMQETALLRAGAVVALASGVFVAFAFTKRPSEEHRKQLTATTEHHPLSRRVPPPMDLNPGYGPLAKGYNGPMGHS